MNPSPTYPWYTIASPEEPVTQGDIILDCPILIPPNELPKDGGSIDGLPIKLFDVVVLTQACDLVNEKVSIVTVCPCFLLQERQESILKSSAGRKSLKQGNIPGYHLLNKCEIENFEVDHRIVDFRSIYGVTLTFLKNHVRNSPPRVRLLPPYREQLSQAFARFFMRVGLPVDITDI